MKEYKNEKLENILEKAIELDCSYALWKVDDGRTYAEMRKYSPLGEDFGMIIDFSKENPVDTFMNDLQDYYSGFDPEEHAAMWIENRGQNGTPDSIKDLLNDAEDIKDMIGELIRHLEEDEEKDLQNYEGSSSRKEMSIGKLKDIIKNLPDDMPVFVACQGYCNYNFDRKQPFDDTDTFGIIYDGKLFITDDCAVDIGNGETL